jgi:hypothetical protein
LVEQRIENPCVPSSNLGLATIFSKHRRAVCSGGVFYTRYPRVASSVWVLVLLLETEISAPLVDKNYLKSNNLVGLSHCKITIAMRSIVTLSAAWTSLLVAHVCTADVVETIDGSRLNGEIVKIYDGKLSLETSFAGVLEISLANVSSFSSDDAESVRLADGTTAVGPVRSAGAGRVSISTSGGAVNAATSDIAAAWTPGEADPAAVAREAELEGQLRKWSYEAAVGLSRDALATR